MDFGAGNHNDVFLRIDARIDRPEKFRVIKNIDVFVDRNGDLRVLILTGERRQ